jgi:UDP-glucose 4-epimerase
VFTIAGFDPTYQVMHERDMARAFERALMPGLRGVFNVAGADPLPLHVLIDQSGGSRIPLPEALVPLLKGRLGFPRIPAGAVDYLKYPCTVDGRRFAEATGFAPKYDLRATLRAVAERREQRRG